MKRVLSLFLSVLMLLSVTAGIDFSALAADMYNIRVQGEYNYDKASEMVKLVNEERAKVGAAPLKMDTELLDAAMQRAAETCLYFDHERPNGTDCYTVSAKMHGENILLGVSSAAKAVDEWMTSPGHRSNILNTGYKSIGVGYFESNGWAYWVQCFSRNELSSVPKKTGVVNTNANVEILKSRVLFSVMPWLVETNSFNADGSMMFGEKAYFRCYLTNPEFLRATANPADGEFKFVSSDPSVIEPDAKGYFTAKKAGTAKVTVVHKNHPDLKAEYTITVKQPIKAERITDTSITLVRDPVKGAAKYEFELYKDDSWWVVDSSTPRAEYNDLQPCTEYKVIVSVYDKDGNILVWRENASFCTKPAKVTGMKTSARGGTGNTLRISWDAQKDADGYNVYRKEGGKYVFKGTTAKNEYTFEDMVPGWEYYFRVTAYKGDPSNAGYGSDEFHTCAACPPMDAPKLTKTGTNTIKVDWNIVNSHGYVIQWSTDPTFEKDLNSLYVTGHNWDSYSINTKDSAEKYYVRVRAWRNFEGGMVYGLWSSGSKIASDALYPVTGLYTSARGGYGEKLKIAWDAQNADSYNVYSYSKTNGWQLAANTTDNYYVFEDVVPGWEYYYKVAAVKNGKEGPLSEQLHTCAACPPMDAPRLTKTGTNTMQVDWEVVNSHGYVIQWSTDPTFSKDLNSLYVTGHSKDSYTITTKGNAEKYYVRVRAWRNFEGGMVYGIWSNPAQLG